MGYKYFIDYIYYKYFFCLELISPYFMMSFDKMLVCTCNTAKFINIFLQTHDFLV